MRGGIPYYVVQKNGYAYWGPTKRMRAAGFHHVSLGRAGPEAERQAQDLNERWQEARTQDPTALGVRQVIVRPAEPGQYVYFLQVGDRIKIGTSRHAFSRVKEIAGSAPARVKRVVIVEGCRADEKRLHSRFASYRTGGEWFVTSRPVLLTLTRSAAAGRVVHDGEGERIGVEESDGRKTESDCGVTALC